MAWLLQAMRLVRFSSSRSSVVVLLTSRESFTSMNVQSLVHGATGVYVGYGHCPVFGMTPVLTSTVRVTVLHWYFDHYSLYLLCGSRYPPIPPPSVLLPVEPMSGLAYCSVYGLMP